MRVDSTRWRHVISHVNEAIFLDRNKSCYLSFYNRMLLLLSSRNVFLRWCHEILAAVYLKLYWKEIIRCNKCIYSLANTNHIREEVFLLVLPIAYNIYGVAFHFINTADRAIKKTTMEWWRILTAICVIKTSFCFEKFITCYIFVLWRN